MSGCLITSIHVNMQVHMHMFTHIHQNTHEHAHMPTHILKYNIVLNTRNNMKAIHLEQCLKGLGGVEFS